jgi:glycosyltransferase involved in cell wall biosynthesis
MRSETTVAVVLKGYPRLSETFIANEIAGLEARGLALRLFSMRQPTDPAVHPVHREIAAPVTYLPEYLHRQPLRVLRGWWRARRLPGYALARQRWLADLLRDPSRNRVRRFGQSAVLAAELPADVGWLHVHFLHTPASVARYAAAMAGLSWSASAHAKDVWTTPTWELRAKLADLRWLVTCTRTGAEHLAALAPAAGRVALVYHGLDVRRFPPPQTPPSLRDGGDPEQPLRLLSVGRCVAKKGTDVLLRALASLPKDLSWRLVHIGGGPLARSLQRQAAALGVAERIEWRGPQPQDQVLASYRAADLFVLACRIAPDGDRDGLPNVLLEAQSQRLACIATDVAGIPELIQHEATGLLVPPDDPAALAVAIKRLARKPDLRRRFGEAGMRRVYEVFSFESAIDALASRFAAIAPPAAACASASMLR